MTRNNFVYIASALLLSIALGGCGIKPDQLKPPAGYEEKDYPRTYPSSGGAPGP